MFTVLLKDLASLYLLPTNAKGVQAIQIIVSHTPIPIYFNDYIVFKLPLEDFMKAIAVDKLE